MANATKRTKSVPREVKTVVYDEVLDGVTLELSRDEVETLLRVFFNVGGNVDGPRGLVDGVTAAIQSAGSFRAIPDSVRGSIYF